MNFYLIFHHNLAFSSIPEEHYGYLIDNVYSKIIDIAETGFPLGLEFTGETLEIIQRLRPQYIKRLQAACHNGVCEVLGSSYSQAIFPLIPVAVNRWNLDFGHKVYKTLLGEISKIAYLNEQVYSESLPALYKERGAQAVVFDWLNASKGNNWPPAYRYQVIRHIPSNLLFLWSDCIAFQKFQKTVWGNINSSDWLEFVDSHRLLNAKISAGNGSFCLYASDAEIFDYQPGSLAPSSMQRGHFDKMRQMLNSFREMGGKIVLPSAVIARQSAEIPGVNKVTTASYSIRTKKQDKYNVTRWAVTGRETAKMNTLCHQLLSLILQLEGRTSNGDDLIHLKKELVALWGSDFRTHTTDEKYETFRSRMGGAVFLAQQLLRKNKKEKTISRIASHTVPSGSEHWNTITGGKKGSSPNIKIQGRRVSLSNKDISMTLLCDKGMAVESLGFSTVSPFALLGTIPHGHFADISLGSDFYSGHLVLVTQEGRQHTDLSCSVDEIEYLESPHGLGVRNKKPLELPGLSIIKTFFLDGKGLTLTYDLYANDLRPASLRLGIWTLLPESFDRKTLYYQCHQGGSLPEHHLLACEDVRQDMPVNPVVTAHHCQGNTSDLLCFGDAEKHIKITTSATELYSVPLFHHETSLAWDQTESFFTRVYYSICERDDVANVFWKGHLRISFVVTATSKYSASHL